MGAAIRAGARADEVARTTFHVTRESVVYDYEVASQGENFPTYEAAGERADALNEASPLDDDPWTVAEFEWGRFEGEWYRLDAIP